MSSNLSHRRPFFRHVRLAGAALVLAAAATLSACDINITDQAEGRSEWKKDYTLAAGGSLEIRNTNGLIEIDPSGGDKVTVTAERIAKAGTDEAAKKAAEEIEIKETVSGSGIVLDAAIHRPTINIGGGSRQVKFHVRAPKGTRLTLSNTNGTIEVRDMTGELQLSTTNGRILGKNLEGNTRAETTNGQVSLDFSAIGSDGITAETTNGRVEITLAKSIKARVNARVTNGAISAEDLPLAITEQSRRRLTATMNGGGPEIRVETTNGGVSLRAK